MSLFNQISRTALFSNYTFWLMIGFAHRLFSIMQPPLETAHNWRQTAVAMVARNFLEIDANIFYPRVDMAGELSGITGMEFPLLNYLIYLVSIPFGYEHWYGRLVNLIFSTAGLWCFYDYLKKVFNAKLAFNTGMVLLFSLWYYYSRKIMPDTFSIALLMMGIWCWHNYIQAAHILFLLGGFVAIFFGVLSKLPAVVFLPFAWPLVASSSNPQKALMGAGLAVTAAASSWWYFYWVPYLDSAYGFHHFFMGNSIESSFNFLIKNGADTLYMFYEKAVGYSGFVLFLIGLFFTYKSDARAKWIALGSLLLVLGLMLKGGSKFVDHEYYVMPFIPFMSFVAGHALEKTKGTVLIVLLLAVGIEGISRKWEDQFVNRPELVELDAWLDKYIASDDLIVVNSPSYPTPIYFAHRKGWLASNKMLQNKQYVRSLAKKNCRYILILKSRFGADVLLPYGQLAENEKFRLYGLDQIDVSQNKSY